jgi:transglutaminase-like putative cysteine protease
MMRRDFLLRLATSLPVATLALNRSGRAAAETALANPGWRTFEIVTSVDVANPVGRTRLWLPVPWSSVSDYQRTLEVRWDAGSAAHVELATLPGYDVRVLQVEWQDATSVGPITLTSRVATRDRQVDLARSASPAERPEEPNVLATYLRPTSLLPTDGIVAETAQKITLNRHGDLDRARAIYDWVVDNTARDPKTPGCGMGDVASMLQTGYLGGKCADINALFVALARAVRIPARDVYGIRVAESRSGFQCLGRGGDITKAQHCRAEFYAVGHGWVPVDPADVRKVVLEEAAGGLAMTDPKVESARTMLFGRWEMNWIAYNHGHDVVLPGSSRGAIPFLMYPNGETADGRLDALSPASFRYQIQVRELAI